MRISKSSSLPKKIKSSSTKNSSLPQFDTWSSVKSSKTKSWWSLLNILWSRLLNYLSKSSHHFKSFSKWSQFLLSHLIIKSNSIKLTTLLKLFKELLLTKALLKLTSMTPMIKKMILKWKKDFYWEETSAHLNFSWIFSTSRISNWICSTYCFNLCLLKNLTLRPQVK